MAARLIHEKSVGQIDGLMYGRNDMTVMIDGEEKQRMIETEIRRTKRMR